jgi:putative acetyltransferase
MNGEDTRPPASPLPARRSAARSRAPEVLIDVEDPTAEDVKALLDAHLAFSRTTTPPEFSFALDATRLSQPDVTLFGARADGVLVGVGALKRLDHRHAELKSMHTRQDLRGHGIGRAMARHIVAFARHQGYLRVSLETGTTDAFAPARALYTSVGFAPCGPFGDYRPSPHNTFMAMPLEA